MTSGMAREDSVNRFSEKTQKILHERALYLKRTTGMQWKIIAERLGISVSMLKYWREKWRME